MLLNKFSKTNLTKKVKINKIYLSDYSINNEYIVLQIVVCTRYE